MIRSRLFGAKQTVSFAAMVLVLAILFFGLVSARADGVLDVLRDMELDGAPHHYYERATKDRFARVRAEIEAGRVTLDRSGEKAFLASLLKALEIPESSQMLVFSTTSLQLSLISPSNPRALYFNEDTYLGFVPGGRVEIISIDPELGGIFYIFDVPKREGPLAVERSRRCMNCHAGSESGYVPGLMIKSVVPGRRGGSLDAFRVEQLGHGVPIEERFGGWYLTGKHGLTNHWANAIGKPGPEDVMGKDVVVPGERFSFSKYLVGTSDVLPQLVHEHQAGFVMRVLRVGYAAREFGARETTKSQIPNAKEGPREGNEARNAVEIEDKLGAVVRELVRYVLFADEARLPVGVEGDAAFVEDFRKGRRVSSSGASLKDFDLRTRMFRYRCSYMIYSPMVEGLPKVAKGAVFAGLKEALGGGRDGAHIPDDERAVIREILRETHPAFAAVGVID